MTLHPPCLIQDEFKYSLSLDAHSLTSKNASVVISLEGQNDLPTVAPTTVSLLEDSVLNIGVLVNLSATDSELGTPLDVVITSLPSKGQLFQTSDGTLAGTRTRIVSAHNLFDVGSVFSQYAERVLAVSSFWGGPPYAGYHPLTILGPPDCKAYGECAQDAAWVRSCAAQPVVWLHIACSDRNVLTRTGD
jgi:hypothetical protein